MGSERSDSKPVASIVLCDACGAPQAAAECCAHCGSPLSELHPAPPLLRATLRWPARLSAIAALCAMALVPVGPGAIRTTGLISRFEAESLSVGMPLEEVRARLGRPYLVLDKTPVDLPTDGEPVWGSAGRWYRERRESETVWVYTTRQDDLVEVVFQDGRLERVPYLPVGGR